MGQEKSNQESSTSQQYTPTAEETELNKLALERQRAAQQGQIQAQSSGLNLINQLLTGQIPGGFYEGMGGISPEAISKQAAYLTKQSLPGYQSQGLADSGVMFKGITQDIANQLLFPAEQYNIGAKQNLLNLALSGQAQVQSPIAGSEATLGSRLAGLRSVNQTGSTTSTYTPSTMNQIGQGMQLGGQVLGGIGGFGTGMGWGGLYKGLGGIK